jgi:sn1-specific diacylglycerol lipase
MMMTARNILQKINSLQLLEKAGREYPQYNLVLTGHSLGAGAATILSFFLHSRYPNLKNYAYSPPGGLLSLEAAQFSESVTMSIVIGDDIVCRLSVPAFERFKQTLISAIKDCKAPKVSLYCDIFILYFIYNFF